MRIIKRQIGTEISCDIGLVRRSLFVSFNIEKWKRSFHNHKMYIRNSFIWYMCEAILNEFQATHTPCVVNIMQKKIHSQRVEPNCKILNCAGPTCVQTQKMLHHSQNLFRILWITWNFDSHSFIEHFKTDVSNAMHEHTVCCGILLKMHSHLFYVRMRWKI